MPRLDGVAATSLIRQFDHRTPIISMTSNSCPQDILNYYSHGMNDILPKPFTRDGLFTILEVRLNVPLFSDRALTRAHRTETPNASQSHVSDAIITPGNHEQRCRSLKGGQ